MLATQQDKKDVCLTMIVRDESKVIERCLKTVLPYIDSWAITDTGSEDDTMEIIERVMKGTPGKLYQEPWVNFGANRTIAFRNAQNHGRYSLILDADDVFTVESEFSWPKMELSHYEMGVEMTGTSFSQARLLRTDLDWEWAGAVHEYPALDESKANLPAPTIHGATIVSMPDGNRRMLDDSRKYLADAELLEAELRRNPEDLRSVFYLAQSYRDGGKLQKAIDAYRRRAAAGGWPEEKWYAQYQVGVLLDRLADEGDNPDRSTDLRGESLLAHLEAYRMRPGRIEPLVALARSLRMRNEYHLAHLFASQVAYADMPGDRLFIDMAAYQWFALDEYAVCCYWLGKHDEALRANAKLLEVAPIDQVPRIRENIRLSKEALSGKE